MRAARDPAGFWLGYALPFAYAAAAHGGGAYALLTRSGAAGERSAAQCALAVLAVAHGRVVAAYLVHEAAHSAIFKSLRANTAAGVLCQWMCVGRRACARGLLPRAARCCRCRGASGCCGCVVPCMTPCDDPALLTPPCAAPARRTATSTMCASYT